MPRKSKVDILDAVNAVCLFGDDLKNGRLPAYINNFYTKVAEALGNEWSRHQVYINLREDRRGLRSKVFENINVDDKADLDKRKSITSSQESSFLTQNATDENDNISDEDFDLLIEVLIRNIIVFSHTLGRRRTIF